LKKILILYPHFPPSNLAGVHRARLFAQHLPTFGWEPVVLTVHENFYEEKLDYNLVKLLPENLRIEKVNAYSIGKFRIIGDIGLRGFFQLYKKAKQLIKDEHFDFLYIPIPSFYCALLGRKLHASTGIKYGIDYIDPWVHNFPGSEKKFSRHWFSTMLAKFLEPIAVKNASLITGVAEGYYKPVLDRNPKLTKVVVGAMPYGGEKMDHEIVASLHIEPYLFKKNANKIQLVYAGAMLPKAYEPLERIFEVISKAKGSFAEVEFHFIGTGKKADDINGYNIKPLAEKYGLWNRFVFEYPSRIPYLDVLVHLNIADGIFILGSTESHYTPSKSYQAILSNKPILAVLHEQSFAVQILEKSNAGIVISFNGQNDLEKITNTFESDFIKWLELRKVYDRENMNLEEFDKFSAYEVTKTLASLLHLTINKK
jgi:hypothetical protein